MELQDLYAVDQIKFCYSARLLPYPLKSINLHVIMKKNNSDYINVSNRWMQENCKPLIGS
jgi:hypothetical protein